jgi:hypothetical protein
MSRRPYHLEDAHPEHVFVSDADGYDIGVLHRYPAKTVGPDGKPLNDAEWQELIETVAAALKPSPLHLNDRELATVLAALRVLQSEDPSEEREKDDIYHIRTDNGAVAQLTNDEIDALCERLNQ